MAQLTLEQRKEKIKQCQDALQQAEALYWELYEDSNPLDEDGNEPEGMEEDTHSSWEVVREGIPSE